MSKSLYKSFGQEFYPYEAIRALKFADKARISDRHALIAHIASQLPQPGARTRLRIAEKFAQRYLTIGGQPGAAATQPFVRLVARQRHAPAQIELLYYRLAQVDTLVGALARDLFYPVCIGGRPPLGLTSAEFAARNGGQLLSIAPLLTRAFILDYAKTCWSFTNRSTIDRSLRVLQGAGLVARERMGELRGHPPAFRLSSHNVSLTTFLFALYDEFLPHVHDANFVLAPNVLPLTDFARTLLLSPAQVEAHCDAARRHQLLAQPARGGLRLVFGSLEALVDALLAKAI